MGRTPVFAIAGMALVAALAGCQQTGTKKQPLRPMDLGFNKKTNPAVAQNGNVQPLNQAYNPNSQQQGVFGQQQGTFPPNSPGGIGQQSNPMNAANGNTPGPNWQEHLTTPHQPMPTGGVIPASANGLKPGMVVPASNLPEPNPAFGPLHQQPIPQPVNPYSNPGSAPGHFPVSQNTGAVHDLPLPTPSQPVATTGNTIPLPPAPPSFPVQNTNYAPAGTPPLPHMESPLPVTPLSPDHNY